MHTNRIATSVLLNKGYRSEHVVCANTQERLKSPVLSLYGPDKVLDQRQAFCDLRDAERSAGVAQSLPCIAAAFHEPPDASKDLGSGHSMA